MKNFKRSLALVLALVMIVGTFASVSAFNLSNQQAWFADAVYDLQNWGVITESDVESAMAQKTIDRKTFTLWVAKILSQDVDGKIWEKGVETRYEDVNYEDGNDDNSYAIAYATANGIVKGYNEGPNYQFGPDDALKLGQGAVIVIRLLSRFGDKGSLSSTYLKNVQEFKDTFDTTEYAAYMWWAQQEDVNVIDDVYKANCTSFADGAALTYGEAAYLIWNAASKAKTSSEFDKGANGVAGTIAEKLNKLNAKINRTYYGVVSKVNGANTDEVNELVIEVQVAANTFVTLTLNKSQAKAEIVDANERKTDNVGTANSTNTYVSVRDFTVGTMVKISYNGNAYAESVNGVLPYNATNLTSIELNNTIIVDSFLVYRYGWAGSNGGYKYNHLYNELAHNPAAAGQKLNKTPVLPAYYDEVLAITKSTESRTVPGTTTKQTVYKISFLGTDYVLATVDTTTGKTMVSAGIEASATDNVIYVYDVDGKEIAKGAIASIYEDILNIAEGQMKFTFADTDGDGDYDILTQNRDSVKFKTVATKLDANGNEVPDYSKVGLNLAATSVNADASNFLFNKTPLRQGETYVDEKVIASSAAGYSTLKAANNGLTMLLMNPVENLPYYKQVALLDGETGDTIKTVTGMVTNVETLGGAVTNYYKMTITAADGTATVVTIPAYSALENANGASIAINKTFQYAVGESTNKVTVDTNCGAASWYTYLINGYKSQYSNGQTADHFPATEANKPTWLLQRTVTVAVDEYANVLTMSGYDLLDSATETEGFVTKVQAGANANQFKVTLAGDKGTTTVDVIASLSGAYDDATLALINKIFYHKVLAGNEAVIYGVNYVAAPTNVLYVEVKNDTNNYIVAGNWTNTWTAAEISGDITNRIFDAPYTYTAAGLTYTTQTAALAPTVLVPEVTNYYNAYTATNYKWVVEAYPQYDANNNLVATKYAYVKVPSGINQVKYSQVSKLAVDFTKSYTLQVVYDGNTFATGATKVLVPFTVYSTTVNPVTSTYDVITNPTYAQIAAYQTHKYYDATTGALDTTMGYGLFYTDANGYIGNLNAGCTYTRYYVDANNTVYTILDYKGLVYQTKADGTLVVETLEAEAVATTDVTTDALAGNIPELTKSYIKSALPSNTEYKAHAKDAGYKYVPGWYRLEVKGAETINVKDDTVIVIATPSELQVGALDKLTYTYTETTFGALKASGSELAVAAYDYYLDPAKGYVTYLVVFGAYATAGKNSDPTPSQPQDPTEVVVDTTKAVVYLPASSITTAYVKTGDDIYYVESSYQALNITTGAKVGTLRYYYSTWNHGANYVHSATGTANVTIPAGHFYLIDLTNNAILQDLGPIYGTQEFTRLGLSKSGQSSDEYSRGSVYVTGTGWCYLHANGKYDGNYWVYTANNQDYTVSVMNETNYNIDISKLAEGTNLGYFGKMTITDVTPTSIIATVNSNTNVDITNLKFQFTYFDYEGNNFYVAEDQDVAHDLPKHMADAMFRAEKGGLPRNISESGLYGDWAAANFPSWNKYVWQRYATHNSYKALVPQWLQMTYEWMAEYTPAAVLDYFTEAYNTALVAGKSAAEIDAAFAMVEKCKKFYAEANENFNDIMNDIYWTADVQNSKLYQYKVQQITSGVAEADVVYPEFTYYYDYATETYIVFNNSIVTK
ncbi:MAG: hypothetical protein E7608_00560 [Ruminococcaceae bacterium]|nr:hypothetical protein [Oscillospiraceae bacterium]